MVPPLGAGFSLGVVPRGLGRSSLLEVGLHVVGQPPPPWRGPPLVTTPPNPTRPQRGLFCPHLQQLVASNSPELVVPRSAAAICHLPDRPAASQNSAPFGAWATASG